MNCGDDSCKKKVDLCTSEDDFGVLTRVSEWVVIYEMGENSHAMGSI